MKVIAFIEQPQGEVIETILRGHQSGGIVGGLWHASRTPPAEDGWIHAPDGDSDELRELTYVDIDTVEATF